jgi:gamma-glutamyl-gamma-aminobutyrate hydrolase PuuD
MSSIFFRFLLTIILFSTISVAEQKNVIGMLSTKNPVYDHELYFSKVFDEIVKDFNAELHIVDYHSIYSQYLTSKTSEQIEDILLTELQKNNIKKVIIPGNYYNVDMSPNDPLPNRQRVTESLLQLSKKGKVKILGICGGMQGILHADGIKLINLMRMGGAVHEHIISYPGPYASNVKLNRIMVNPASNLAKLIKNDKIQVTNNGWIILNLPDYHTETVSLEKSNLEKLNDKGYKIVGFDQHGIIEIIEDKYGNTYFQSYPEGLVLNRNKKNNYGTQSVEGSTLGMVQYFEHFIKD